MATATTATSTTGVNTSRGTKRDSDAPAAEPANAPTISGIKSGNCTRTRRK
jgi:hypothetical protein